MSSIDAALPDQPEACRRNLGPAQARRRMRFGVAAFVVSGIVLVALVALGAPRLARLGLLVPLAIAGIGVMQGREKT